MFIKKPSPIAGSEITPETTYLNRRNFMRPGTVPPTAVATGYIYRELNSPPQPKWAPQPLADLPDIITPNQLTTSSTTAPSTQPTSDNATASAPPPENPPGFVPDEPRTTFQNITNYNNFYEFSTDKDGVASAAAGFIARP